MWPLCGFRCAQGEHSACIRITEPEEKHTVTATSGPLIEGTVYATGEEHNVKHVALECKQRLDVLRFLRMSFSYVELSHGPVAQTGL